MTYPDEGRESKEGQMQSYTVSRRRSRIEKRMYSCTSPSTHKTPFSRTEP